MHALNKLISRKGLLRNLNHSSAKTWQTINELCNFKTKRRILPPRLIIDEISVAQEPVEIANYFNKYFSEIGDKLASKITPRNTNTPDYSSSLNNPRSSFFLVPTTPNEIIDIITTLNDKKATRKNDPEIKFLKYSKIIIAKYLSKIFDLCIIKGIYPESLKVAEVVPIYKNGNENKATNYRPISLLSPINKIFEKLIYNRLISYLDKYDLLSPNQFGFRKNMSTTDAINYIHDNIVKNNEYLFYIYGLYTCSIFMDLSKAFDTVNHKLLLQKLSKHFGIRGKPLDLIKDYLHERYQYTCFNGICSQTLKIILGVPQGSCLGPLLFIMYINDVPMTSNFSTTLFAYTYLSLSNSNLKILERNTNIELTKIDKWFCENKLSINYNKTFFLKSNSKTSFREFLFSSCTDIPTKTSSS